MQAQQRYKLFSELFEIACEKAQRNVSDIQVLAVSKGQSAEHIKSFLELPTFPRELGENYSEELLLKSKEISNIRWHYLGALQSRKFKEIFQIAQVIHGVSREKELQALEAFSNQAPSFFIQLNISSEGQKLGASWDEAQALLESLSKKNLDAKFLGFMGMAAELGEGVSESNVRKQFASLRDFRDSHAPKKKLSMGMSADFHLAIQEGSDLIRVGSTIFGTRS